MATIKTKFTVGLFVVIGFGIATIAIIWLGMSHYFEEGKYFVSFFDESVQGLSNDSPVKYRGVSIGRVDNISVAKDGRLIRVVLKIDSEIKQLTDLVAQLKSIGITGIMFVELDKKSKIDEKEPDLSPRIAFESQYPVVATKPSEISRFMQGIDDLLNQFLEFDVGGISTQLKNSLKGIEQTIKDAEIKQLSSDIQSVLTHAQTLIEPGKWEKIITTIETTGADIRRLAAHADQTMLSADKTIVHMDDMLTKNQNGLANAVGNFSSTMQKADDIMANGKDLIQNVSDLSEEISGLLNDGSVLINGVDTKLYHLQQSLLVTSRNLEKTSTDLSRLIELLLDQPSQLVFGEPPPSKKIERP